MPFTLSHPMFVFPFKRMSPKYVSFTGLVLGSMSPDFEYFLMLEPFRSIGHSFAGLLFQAIPFSIAFAFLFHHIVKKPLALHLPSLYQLDRRAYGMAGEWNLRTVKEWVVFLTSVIIGFVTHILVDAFTHASGFFVSLLPFLREVVILSFPLYKLLQYGFSLIGLLAVIGVIAYGLFRSNAGTRDLPQVSRQQKIAYWSISLLISIMVTVLKIAASDGGNTIGILAVAPISGLMLGLLVTSLVAQSKLRLFR